MHSVVSLSAAVVATLVIVTLRARRKSREAGFPQGPAPLPVIGNALEIDASRPWLTFTKWQATYGDLVYCNVFGQDVVVVNSEKVAEDLMDKRSRNYSGRMDMSSILDPFSGAIILGAVFDHEIDGDPENDAMLQTVVKGTDYAVRIASPDWIALTTILPFCKYIPTWLPGGALNAPNGKRIMNEMLDIPFDITEKRVDAGEIGHCVVLDAFERFRGTTKVSDFENIMKHACGTAYAAGEETTGSSLIVFTLAMVLHPHVQKRAQEEIESVVGSDRLPDFNDRPSLPYVEAIFRETARWRPIVPLAIPHSATDEDMYDGYVIPKGAVIVPNVWAMSRNEEKYPFPETFNPERFLDANGNLAEEMPNFVFGFGRRICPGRHLAKNSVWIAMAQILAFFSIEKAKDAFGQPVEPNPQWTQGVTSYPKDFPCAFVSRRA
ncbi:cytochrome P450 [Coniophora puteana RWD-64-598 SS2]|uniref:Cytochrome P450 n=1 Tax=Coniophora puteana (strain RWD-64-598) TaxID=741705 RepID=A0A5M3N0N5_CONPW|nr:cytochrome P450 [Coniophora puteana RWD-64-598 SS2]EIW84451.1 cytochrome P450 [Coniophora puteana RWD-64-598 SS2]